MSILSFPTLDGFAPSWADVSFRVSPTIAGGGVAGQILGAVAGAAGLIEIADIKSLDSGWEIEIGEQRHGGRVIKRTRGSVKNTAKAVFYASGYKKLLRGLLAAAPSRGNQKLIGLVHYNISVQFTPPGLPDILEFRIKGCRMMGRNMNGSEGNDAIEVEVALNPAEVVDVVDGVEVAPL